MTGGAARSPPGTGQSVGTPQQVNSSQPEPEPEPQLLLGLRGHVLDLVLGQLSQTAQQALLRTSKAVREAVLHHVSPLKFTPGQGSCDELCKLLSARAAPLQLVLDLSAASHAVASALLSQLAAQSETACVTELEVRIAEGEEHRPHTVSRPTNERLAQIMAQVTLCYG